MLKLMTFNFNVRFTLSVSLVNLFSVNQGARGMPDNVFTLGISSLWDEVCHMPVGGVWWLNVDRYADAVSLFNQTLAAQAKTATLPRWLWETNPRISFP